MHSAYIDLWKCDKVSIWGEMSFVMLYKLYWFLFNLIWSDFKEYLENFQQIDEAYFHSNLVLLQNKYWGIGNMK